MAAPSFAWRIPSGHRDKPPEKRSSIRPPTGSAIRSPDPTRPRTSIVIGPTYYFRRGNVDIFEATNEGGWVKYVNPPWVYASAAQYAMRDLSELLRATSVQGTGSSFHVTRIDSNDPYFQGQSEDSLTVQTGRRGYVRSIVSIFSGMSSQFNEKPTFQVVRTRILFSRIGTAPSFRHHRRRG